MFLLTLTSQILRIIDGLVRNVLGERTRATLPTRYAATESPAAKRRETAPAPAAALVEEPHSGAAAPPKAKPRTPKRASPARKDKPAAPQLAGATRSALPKLSAEARYADTVWVPRILWALAWSAEQNLGPQTAADLARILGREAGLKVAPNNVARAFRDFAADQRTKGLWKATGKKYEITAAGKKTLAKIG